ncbi:glycosyltransferase family 4 protein [uncultured Oscillibacter sp.]|uniref:glycosyltransferase family 4 protein n=1 Tax=uncultured Oscillibacter sp. TaxID=876091 RepID=UPI00262C6266|nr:glycosyltransferase family 4 protein [uncultured Oscillibacter sp.]
MDILILANFCGDLTEKGNSRFLYLADMLAEKHSVEVVTSDFNHGSKVHYTKPLLKHSYPITLLHEKGYPKNVCLRRFASHREFGRNFAAYLEKRKTPDVIYAAIPSLTAPLAAANYCKRKGIRFVIDVQDLWPEAFKMVFHMPVVSTLMFTPFRSMADRIYSAADAVCAVSETYVSRAMSVNQKAGRGTCVFLGTRLEDFDKNARDNAVTDKPEGALWLGYCGTLGSSYDLICVIDALALLRQRGKVPPKFIIMGDGPRRTEFERYVQKKNVDAVFMGMLPYAEMCGRLCACDIVVNPITTGAAQSIINKHADYAACGRPVLNTQESPEYQNLVDAYHMGFNCQNGNAGDLADKLLQLLENPDLRQELGRNSRRCAEERFDRKQSYQALERALEGMQ